MYGRIVVGVDGSGPSSAALTWALARASADDLPVLVVHVVEPGADPDTAEELLKSTIAAARARMPRLTLTGQLLHGPAARQLAEVATSHDLIVLGTHKTGYLSGRVLGTRGLVVASAAPCSVVVVPDAAPAGRTGILVGVDAHDPAHTAALAGAREAARLHEDLTLIRATPAASASDTGTDRAILADAAAAAVAVADGLEVRSRLSRRRPAEALLDASRSSSLLVIGAPSDETAAQRHLGSVSYEVLLNINTAVMIAREDTP